MAAKSKANPLYLSRGQLMVRYFFVFYYIVILKCMKDFIFCKISAVYYLCFKCKKINTLISRCSWTMKKKAKDANTFGIYYSLKTKVRVRHCNAIYDQNTIDRWTKGCIFPFPKGELGIAKTYWGVTLTFIAAKIYNALLCNCIKPKFEKILRKNQNGFQRNWSTTSQILTIIEF